jgi:hypothetical protein
MRRLAGYAVIGLVAWFVFTAPDAAADAVHGLFAGLEAAGDSFATFLERVFA